jgi:hypothetical protein
MASLPAAPQSDTKMAATVLFSFADVFESDLARTSGFETASPGEHYAGNETAIQIHIDGLT